MLVSNIGCYAGNSKLEFASTIMLVTQPTCGTSHFDFTPRRIQHKRFFKRMTKYYSNHEACHQLELYVLSCGDVHPNPGPTRRNGNNDSNNNLPLQSQEQRNTKLSVFYANAKSIVNKIAKLQTEIASNSFDIIVFTETHLDSSITDAKIFGSEYCSYRKDRQQGGRSGGGVLVASKRWIKVSLREGLAYESGLLFIDILTANNKKKTMGVFYRPPNSNLTVLEDLQNSLRLQSTLRGTIFFKMYFLGQNEVLRIIFHLKKKLSKKSES